jgi:hypothetical protein
MKNSIVILIVVTLTVLANDAMSQEIAPPRPSVSFVGGVDLSEQTSFFGSFFPSTDLVAGLSPLIYVGVGWKVHDMLKLSPALGFDYLNNQPILSIRLSPNYNIFWGWFDLEWKPDNGGWAFGQGEAKVFDWLSVGAEYEFWGAYDNLEGWSLGGGPNMVLELGDLGLEVALHYRDDGKQTNVEFVSRANVYLF